MIYTSKPSNFNSTIEIVSCLIEYDSKILFLLRQDHKSYPNQRWPPAWKVNNWESLEDAIIRETFEETWIQLDQKNIKYLWKNYVRHWSFDFIYHEYFYKLENLSEIKIHPDEHKKFGWFFSQESLKLNLVDDQDICMKNFMKWKSSLKVIKIPCNPL